MDINGPFFVDASLASQSMSLSEVGTRFLKLLELLDGIDPLLRNWFHPTGSDTRVLLSRDLPTLEKLIYASSCLDGATNPRLDFGYCIGASTKSDEAVWDACSMILMMKAGGRNANRVWLQTPWKVIPDPHLTSYAIIKKMLFAVADAFEPIVSKAYPSALNRDDWAPKKTNPICPAWMFLLPKALASQVTPPATAVTQTRADGSLFMAVTDETFDVTNPDHVAGSKAMQAAIAPINHPSLFQTADTPGRS